MAVLKRQRLDPSVTYDPDHPISDRFALAWSYLQRFENTWDFLTDADLRILQNISQQNRARMVDHRLILETDEDLEHTYAEMEDAQYQVDVKDQIHFILHTEIYLSILDTTDLDGLDGIKTFIHDPDYAVESTTEFKKQCLRILQKRIKQRKQEIEAEIYSMSFEQRDAFIKSTPGFAEFATKIQEQIAEERKTYKFATMSKSELIQEYKENAEAIVEICAAEDEGVELSVLVDQNAHIFSLLLAPIAPIRDAINTKLPSFLENANLVATLSADLVSKLRELGELNPLQKEVAVLIHEATETIAICMAVASEKLNNVVGRPGSTRRTLSLFPQAQTTENRAHEGVLSLKKNLSQAFRGCALAAMEMDEQLTDAWQKKFLRILTDTCLPFANKAIELAELQMLPKEDDEEETAQEYGCRMYQHVDHLVTLTLTLLKQCNQLDPALNAERKILLTCIEDICLNALRRLTHTFLCKQKALEALSFVLTRIQLLEPFLHENALKRFLSIKKTLQEHRLESWSTLQKNAQISRDSKGRLRKVPDGATERLQEWYREKLYDYTQTFPWENASQEDESAKIAYATAVSRYAYPSDTKILIHYYSDILRRAEEIGAPYTLKPRDPSEPKETTEAAATSTPQTAQEPDLKLSFLK